MTVFVLLYIVGHLPHKWTKLIVVWNVNIYSLIENLPKIHFYTGMIYRSVLVKFGYISYVRSKMNHSKLCFKSFGFWYRSSILYVSHNLGLFKGTLKVMHRSLDLWKCVVNLNIVRSTGIRTNLIGHHVTLLLADFKNVLPL